MGLRVDCFVGFFHYPVMIMSASTHAFRYPLFESGTKTGCEHRCIQKRYSYFNPMSAVKQILLLR